MPRIWRARWAAARKWEEVADALAAGFAEALSEPPACDLTPRERELARELRLGNLRHREPGTCAGSRSPASTGASGRAKRASRHCPS